MKLLFIQDNGINESLAITELSAWLKQRGVHTALLLEQEERDFSAAVKAEMPDVVLVACEVMAERWCLNVLPRLRAALGAGIPILVGGTAPTFNPGLLEEPAVDILLRGEAEEAVWEFLEHRSTGQPVWNLRNFSFKRNGHIVHNPLRPALPDLGCLPMPDRELYYSRYPFMRNFAWRKFSSGRGCIHRCSYCYNEVFKELYGGAAPVRRKRPEQVVAEIAEMLVRHPMQHVHFSDDLFTLDKRWLREFCRIYPTRITLPFSLNTAVENLDTDTVRALARAGARAIAIGVETGNEITRKKILKKTISTDLIRRKARLIKDAGIKLVTFNMIGIPGESFTDACSTIRLNEGIGTDHMRVGFAMPIPNTSMTQGALQDGSLDPAHAMEEPQGAFALQKPVFRVPDPERLSKLYYLSNLYPFVQPSHYFSRLDRLPLSRILTLLDLLSPYHEKRIFGLGVINGLRYFRHTGSPNNRTTNYVSLI